MKKIATFGLILVMSIVLFCGCATSERYSAIYQSGYDAGYTVAQKENEANMLLMQNAVPPVSDVEETAALPTAAQTDMAAEEGLETVPTQESENKPTESSKRPTSSPKPKASAKPKPKVSVAPGVFDEETVLSQIEVTEYKTSGRRNNYVAFELVNNSGFDLELEMNLLYKDAEGNVIGADNESRILVNSGDKTAAYFLVDKVPETVEYTLSAMQQERVFSGVQYLSYEYAMMSDKVIVSVTNDGDIPVQYVEATVLFFNKGKFVGATDNFLTDSQSEIKPGKKISEELELYDQVFDSVQIYLTGKIE